MKDMGAFPAMTPEAGGYSEGMTLRQYYAGQAMMGIISCNSGVSVNGEASYQPEHIAKSSVLYADALLAELAKEE